MPFSPVCRGLSNVLKYNELYVVTSKGVYYLSEVKNYTEAEVLIKKSSPFKIDTKLLLKPEKIPSRKEEAFFKDLGRQRDDDEVEKAPAILKKSLRCNMHEDNSQANQLIIYTKMLRG